MNQMMSNILSSYFDDEQISEFQIILKKDIIHENSWFIALSPEEKRQIESDIAFASNYESKIDVLITFAELKLEQEKFIEFLLYIGETSVLEGQLNGAKRIYYYILNKLHEDEKYESIYAYSLYELGDIFSRQADYVNCIKYLNRAEKMFSIQNDFRGSVKCHNLLGIIHGERGNLVKAKHHFELCLSKIDYQEDKSFLTVLDINLGIVCNMQGDYDQALNYFKRGLTKCELNKDQKKVAELRNNLGILFISKLDYNSAIAEFDKSISIASQMGYKAALSISYLNKSYAYTMLGDYQLSTAFANIAMSISIQLDDKLTIADLYKIKGITEKKQKNYVSSENYLLTSIRINKEYGNLLNLAESSYELGLLYIEIDEIDKSNKYLDSAFKIFKKLKIAPMIKKIKSITREAIN